MHVTLPDPFVLAETEDSSFLLRRTQWRSRLLAVRSDNDGFVITWTAYMEMITTGVHAKMSTNMMTSMKAIQHNAAR